MNNIENIIKEFLERSERDEVEFIKMCNKDKISLENVISKYKWAIQKFGNKNKIARNYEKSLYNLISALRINGHIKYKI